MFSKNYYKNFKGRADTKWKRFPNLEELGNIFETDKGSAHGYTTEVYPRYLGPIRYFPVNFLEIGVLEGASARMWNDFFIHPKKQLIFWDKNKECKKFVPKGSIFRRVNCFNIKEIRASASSLPSLDVVVDDGHHSPGTIINALTVLWDKLNPGGLYFIEDINGRWDRLDVIYDFIKKHHFIETVIHNEMVCVRKYK